jgi:hypothetical protein
MISFARDTEKEHREEFEPRITRMNTDKKKLFSHPCLSV